MIVFMCHCYLNSLFCVKVISLKGLEYMKRNKTKKPYKDFQKILKSKKNKKTQKNFLIRILHEIPS